MRCHLTFTQKHHSICSIFFFLFQLWQIRRHFFFCFYLWVQILNFSFSSHFFLRCLSLSLFLFLLSIVSSPSFSLPLFRSMEMNVVCVCASFIAISTSNNQTYVMYCQRLLLSTSLPFFFFNSTVFESVCVNVYGILILNWCENVITVVHIF